MRLALMLAACLAPAAHASGWRGDGVGHFPDAETPTGLAEVWRRDLGGPGNASPVVLGDLVCATVEPSDLVCLDRHTGEERFRGAHGFEVTLPEGGRAAHAADVARYRAAEAELGTLRRRFSKLQRALRGAGGADVQAELDQVTQAMDAATATMAALRDRVAPETNDLVGYATPTPFAHDGHVYALFGTGVLSRWSADGTRDWSVWLGPPPDQMLGYLSGPSASPRIVDGVLIAPHGHLRGLDPETGEVLWEHDDPWHHYGPPSPVRIGGRTRLARPDGALVDPKTGEVVARNLGDIWYVSHVHDGERLYALEPRAIDTIKRAGTVRLGAWSLAGGSPSPLWSVDVPTKDTFYTAPVAFGGKVFLVTIKGALIALDATTGAELGRRSLAQELGDEPFYMSPTQVGDRLLVGSGEGRIHVVEPTAALDVVAVVEVGENRSSPAVVGDRLYLRSVDGIVALDLTP